MSPIEQIEGTPPAVTALSATNLSIAELKRVIDTNKTGDDELLEMYLMAALEQAQQPPPYGCGRQLVPVPVNPTDDPVTVLVQTYGRRHVPLPDAREITAVTADGVATTVWRTLVRDGLVVELVLPSTDASWWTAGRTDVGDVAVTGHFGFLDIPVTLKDAIYTLAARGYWERDTRFADSVAVADSGPSQAYFRQLPQRVKLAFQSFALPAAVGGLA